jgi:catechol 2,3-dioxygenase-like lactoylglutathione lyase family enzyme
MKWLLTFASLAALVPQPSYAQLAAPNAAGVAMGHVHLNVKDVELQRKLWMEHFGAVPLHKNGVAGVSVPGMLILFDRQASTGGSVGTVLDHFGFKVPNLAEALQRWRAAGYEVLREFTGTEGFANAYLLGPDAVKIELQQDTALPVRALSYHLHYVLGAGNDLKLRDWYAETFSLVSRKRGEHDTADVPGMNLTFTTSATPPTLGTKGRAVDHVGFEVRNLEAFCRKLEARGVKFDVPYAKSRGGIATATLTDPFGVSIELTEGLDKF